MNTEVLESNLIEIFSEAQNGLQFHKEQLKVLQKTFNEWSSCLNDFFETFFGLIQRLLTVIKREPATERLVDFIAKFTIFTAPKRSHVKEDEDESSSDEETEENKILDNFAHLLLLRLMGFSQAKDKAVRFRITQMVAKVLNYARDDPSIRIHSSILDDTLEPLLVFLYDRYAIVRTQAAIALSFYQDPNDSDCHVTNALAWSMENDSTAEVRRCIVANLVLTSHTLDHVIKRTRDISDAVRRCTFLVLSEKCTIRQLKIKQRLQLLRDGLQDRNDSVKEACMRGLLRNWCINLGGDIYDLLRRLDLESSSDICEIVVMSIFEDLLDEELIQSFENLLNIPNDDTDGSETQDVPINEEDDPVAMEQDSVTTNVGRTCVIPLENLQTEAVFFWRCLCKYFKTKYDETVDPKHLEHLESVTPTLFNFCEYLSNCFASIDLITDAEDSCDSHMTNEFILSELCSIIKYLDFTDEVGRRRLGQLVYSLITSGRVPAGLVSSLLSEQTAIWPQESFRIEKLLEIIAEIRYPGTSDSHNITSEISLTNMTHLELKEDANSLLKCLSVTTELFGKLRMGKLNASLRTLVESLLFPCIKNENPYIRDMAINALGRACLLNLELARDHILLFIQVSTVDHETVQATALKVVFDLLHVFGLDAFSERQQESNDKQQQQQQQEEGDGSGNIAEKDRQSISTHEEDEILPPPMSPSSDAPDTTEQTTQKFLIILTKFLDGDSFLLKSVAVEGLSKLLLSSRIISVKLLVRLFIIWYNPAHQDNSHSRTLLGTFFTEYASSGQVYREHITECYILLIKTILEAPPTSPLSDIDVNNVTSFVLSLSAPVKPEEDSPHDSLALSVANYLLSDDMSCDQVWCRTLCKALSLMTLTKTNKSNARDLLTVLHQLCEEIKDRQSVKHLEKLKTRLLKVIPNNAQEGIVADESDNDSKQCESEKENIDSAPPTPTQKPDSTPHHPINRSVCMSEQINPTTHQRLSAKAITRSTTRKTRSSKRINSKRKINRNEEGDSDDSLIGEHSPFLRVTKSRTDNSLSID